MFLKKSSLSRLRYVPPTPMTTMKALKSVFAMTTIMVASMFGSSMMSTMGVVSVSAMAEEHRMDEYRKR